TGEHNRSMLPETVAQSRSNLDRNHEFAPSVSTGRRAFAALILFRRAGLFPSFSFLARGRPASIGQIACGAIALVGACALVAPVGLAAQPGSTGVYAQASPPAAPLHGTTEIAKLLDRSPGLLIAGEPVNVRLLRRFYAGHGFEPVWRSRPAQANALLNAVL